MKKISLRFFLASLTFAIGLLFTSFLLLNQKLPDVPIPESQKLRNSNFIAYSQISKSQQKYWDEVLLSRFNESPLLVLADSSDELYRFMLIPTFHAPVVIRIWRSKNEYFITTKKTNGEGGFGMKKFGKLSFNKTRTLTEAEWNVFLNLINEAMFWDMPYSDKNDDPVLDGASWIIEGYSNKNHHTVDRITPSKEFGKACVYLLKLSGLEADYEGYYSSN